VGPKDGLDNFYIICVKQHEMSILRFVEYMPPVVTLILTEKLLKKCDMLAIILFI